MSSRRADRCIGGNDSSRQFDAGPHAEGKALPFQPKPSTAIPSARLPNGIERLKTLKSAIKFLSVLCALQLRLKCKGWSSALCQGDSEADGMCIIHMGSHLLHGVPAAEPDAAPESPARFYRTGQTRQVSFRMQQVASMTVQSTPLLETVIREQIEKRLGVSFLSGDTVSNQLAKAQDLVMILPRPLRARQWYELGENARDARLVEWLSALVLLRLAGNVILICPFLAALRLAGASPLWTQASNSPRASRRHQGRRV